MIYVFKTTVDSKLKLESATAVLHELLPHALWNFDLEDCDNILRIDSADNIIHSIKVLFKIYDFECEELE